MKTYTKNEQVVFNSIAAASFRGGISVIEDVITDTLDAKQARGVIASLVKKGKVFVEDSVVDEKESAVYWPIHSEHGVCFLCDCISEDEYKTFLIKDNEIA